jgi:CheY-like chemotaxis protein
MIGAVTRSVLIVDDDPEFRELARRLLAASSVTVIGEADSVMAALAAAVQLKPSAVLADVELPDGDGLALARELAALPWRPRIVLTSIDGDITTTGEAPARRRPRVREQGRAPRRPHSATARRRIARKLRSRSTAARCQGRCES